MKIRTLAAPVLVACTFAACSSGVNPVVQTLQDALQGNRSVTDAQLNPAFRYIRITVGGRVSFLALGSEDKHPQGPIEVWFSAQREVLRLQNGRVVGAAGVTTEWRSVTLPEMPSWSALARSQQPLLWVRIRDVMPGYRLGVRDELVLRAVPPPKESALQGVDAPSLSWFEERFQTGVVAGRLTRLVTDVAIDRVLPPARYAVDLRDGKEIVVYGEQCLAPEFCFTWQRWNVEKR